MKIMKLLHKALLPFTLLLPFAVFSQDEGDILGKTETISLALDYNYDIKVANNNIEQAANSASIYNSGYLPSLSANAGGNYNITSISATLADGSENSANGLKTNSLNAGLGLNYTIYDGNGRKYNYEILKEKTTI
jgi:outer membrane protein TolC